MRLKDGYQKCPKCDGAGCWSCLRKGWRYRCPPCGNEEPGLVTESEDNIACGDCQAVYSKSGALIPTEEKERQSRCPRCGNGLQGKAACNNCNQKVRP